MHDAAAFRHHNLGVADGEFQIPIGLLRRCDHHVTKRVQELFVEAEFDVHAVVGLQIDAG